LAKLHLLVKVRKRVATVTGTVPSRELAQRAVACLNQLPDLFEVRDAIHVAGEPFVPPPPLVVKEYKPTNSPTTLTGLPGDRRKDSPSTVGTWKPLPVASNTMPIPIISHLPEPSTVEPPGPKDAKKAAAPADAAAIANAVKSLMVGDERYRLL